MNMQNKNKRPEMTNAGIAASYTVSVTDEFGNTRKTHITGERPLTIYIDKQEIVTLMTLGKFPELLVMGYLHNQGFIKTVAEIKAVQVDWEIESATVVTTNGSDNWDAKLKKRNLGEDSMPRTLDRCVSSCGNACSGSRSKLRTGAGLCFRP